MRRALLVSCLVLSTAACAPSPLVRAAEQADPASLATLRATLAAGVANGTLGPNDAKDVARALAKREVEQSTTPAGVQRIEELRACAREIEGPLTDRADRHDAIGGAAALLLVEEKVRGAWHYGRFAERPADDPDAVLRAPGAWSLTSHGDGDLRRKLMVDPYGEVRRGALHAAADADDEADVEPALDAARFDPHPRARKEAILTAGALGSERAVLGLFDLWPRADADAREALATAWGMERAFTHGGRDRLVWVIETQHGPAVIVAAKRLLAEKGDAAAGEAAGAFEREIGAGSAENRARAIREAPEGLSSVETAIDKAMTDADDIVAVAALARRLAGARDAEKRSALVAKLLLVAQGSGSGAEHARLALARASVREVVPILEREAATADPGARARAGSALARFGDYPRAAVVAADPDASVRTTVACAILRAASHPANDP